MAASIAFKDGMRRANPVLLEPMMAVEVETPENFVGNVIGDLSSRRGMIQGQEEVAGMEGVRAGELLWGNVRYSSRARSRHPAPPPSPTGHYPHLTVRA